MNTVEQARQIASELQSKLATASARATALATERRRLAYAASTGNASAKSRLEKLNADSAVVLIENENANIALDEARHRLAEAESKAAIAEQRAAAERLSGRVKELATKIESHGPAISKALASFCAEFAGLKDDLESMRGLGVELAPARLVNIGFADLLTHTVRAVDISVGDLVAPGRRYAAEFLTAGYARKANEFADALLGEKVEAA